MWILCHFFSSSLTNMDFWFYTLNHKCNVNFSRYHQIVSALGSSWQSWPKFAWFQSLLLPCLLPCILPYRAHVLPTESRNSPGSFNCPDDQWWRWNGPWSTHFGGCCCHGVLSFGPAPHLHGLPPFLPSDESAGCPSCFTIGRDNQSHALFSAPQERGPLPFWAALWEAVKTWCHAPLMIHL